MIGLVKSRMGAVAWGLWPTPRFPSPLISRVEGRRAGVARGSRPTPRLQPLHVARNVRISRIARPHLLHAKSLCDLLLFGLQYLDADEGSNYEAQRLGPPLKVGEDALAILLLIVVGARIPVAHSVPKGVVE